MAVLIWLAARSGELPGASWLSWRRHPRAFKIIMVLDILVFVFALFGAIACLMTASR
jgi:hypothetical protein